MSRYEEEIWAQPDAVASFLGSQVDRAGALADELRGVRIRWIVIAARGSSDNAARYGQYLFTIRNRLPVALATPSAFTVYHSPPRMHDSLVVGISQSGASPDVAAVVAEARRQGCPTLAITAAPDSPLATQADHLLELGVAEQAVAATMTYTVSLAALALLSASLRGESEDLASLEASPAAMRRTLEQIAPAIGGAAVAGEGVWMVVGRGFNYGTAFEIGLKLIEVAGVPVESYSPADFRHGPIAGAGAGSRVLLIAPRGPTLPDMSELLGSLAARGTHTIALSDDPSLLRAAASGYPLPGTLPEWLSPLITVIPGQLLALRLAERRGFDPDHPAGLRKITETF